MARHVGHQNTYEELPEELKEQLAKNGDEHGTTLSRLRPRQELLQEHNRHLDLLDAGTLAPRKLTLPPPYPPTRTRISHVTWTSLKRLKIQKRDSNDAICLRTITKPYVHSASIAIVEDESGDTARLSVHNLDDSPADNVFPEGSILVVKQPCWSHVAKGGYHIRVDHPTDLVVLDAADILVPQAWRTEKAIDIDQTAAEMKKEGDLMFLNKRFRRALKLYENGVALLQGSLEYSKLVDLYRKICGVNIVLLRFDDAVESLSQAVSVHATMGSTTTDSSSANSPLIKSWLHSRSLEDPQGVLVDLPKPLRDLAFRIKYDRGVYQEDPGYDLPTMSAFVGPLTLHVDAADYIHDTGIQKTEDRGRGLFAKRDFKAGDLVLAEKAFAMPGYFFNDPSSECALYNLGDGTASDRSGAWLFKELVQKLQANPTLRGDFFNMDDGGYWAEHGWEIEAGDEIPVDVFRIDQIRRLNCFSAPIRSLDVLTQETPMRNGFWIRTSYINHSCLPNSARTFIGDVLLLRATRYIATGEEITAQYLNPELRLNDRQRSFKDTWGFECTCTLCRNDTETGSEREDARMAIFEELKSTAMKLGNHASITALKKFTRRLRDLEALYEDTQDASLPRLTLIHPTLFLTESWRRLKQTDKMLESGIKLLRNFGIETTISDDSYSVIKNSGLVNVECVRVLKYISEGYTLKGETALSSSILDIAKVWFRIITGADIDSEKLLGT